MTQKLDRRTFMKSTAAIGAGLFVAGSAYGADDANKDTINVALLGAGPQGQALMNAIAKMGKTLNMRFVAVCDIWEKGNLARVSKTLNAYKAYGFKGTPYVDYKEMLDKETDLDAVIIATPDFWHAEQTVACLKKGLHVYCEKEMSNTLEGAKQMALTAKETGKLLQIGHQRRSNPRYRHCYEKYIQEAKLLGRITTINGQWNRSRQACIDNVCPPGQEIDEATLNKYGFKDMKQFMNWRWYKGLGGGPIVDLGSHQIDIYSWFLDAQPISVVASGGTDYWTDHEWYDNVITIYEYKTKEGIVRASYQTTTTNSANGYYECFMGDEGTLLITEASARGSIYRESWVDEQKWEPWVAKGYINKTGGILAKKADENVTADLRESVPAAEYKIPVTMSVAYHQPHLVNFFDAIRGKAKLNCPAEIGYETAVTVLKINEAIEKGCKLEFKPEDFKV